MYKCIIKPGLDLCVALVLLSLLLPIFVIVAVFIKLDSSGPVFFRQQRIGKGMKYFSIFKFRTMVVNNETHTSTKANDPRITRVGKFLRRTSIDELPQLINVLLGHMSLIGPRPSIEREIATHGEKKFRRRVTQKPGITGLQQCTLRSRATPRQKLLLDAHYCRKVGVCLDVWIVYMTLKMVFFKSKMAN